ncbi:MAG: DMT family transporter [Hyphomicrobiaceae bacterium]
MSPLEWGMLLALSLLWGGSYFFTGVAVRELPTFTVVVGRVAIAAVILLTILKISGQRAGGTPARWSSELWLMFAGMGFINNVVPFSLIVWGQSHVASGVAAIFNATTPLFTVFVAHFLTVDEKLTTGRIAGILIGIAGVAVLVGVDVAAGLDSNVWAQAAFLAAALSYAFAGVFGRRFRAMGTTPIETAAGQVTMSSIMLIPIMLYVDQPWTLPMPSAATIGALFGVAALSTALAYILYFRILATAGATNLLLVTMLLPVSAILLGTAFLGEVLETKHFIGMALIGLGLAAIDGRPWRWLRGQ